MRNEENLANYHKQRNIATSIKRKSKQNYEMKIVEGIKTDKKQFYKYVRNKTKSQTGVGTVLDIKGNFTTSDKETADSLNKAFQSVFVHEENLAIESDIMLNKDDKIDNTDTFLEISDEEIIKSFSSLEEGKASGPDEISVSILKNCQDSLLLPIKLIYNKSFREGRVPALWKCANVTPIYKKGSKSDCLNYRPVSLTCILCKLLERIIKERMITQLMENKWFNVTQHGFSKNKSTVSNLIDFYDAVSEEMDRGNPVDIFYFDFAKAFDTVPHSKLLIKLKNLNLDEKIVKWIQDYLHDRVQRVIIRGVQSEWLEVYSGVPQGSVIGPILFLIYINDIHDEIESKLNIFADDTKMMNRVGDEEGRSEVERDLKRLEQWCEKNGMKLNLEKCCVMHCGKNNMKKNYKMFDKLLRKTECEKDLGILVNPDMKFKEQAFAASKKANKVLGMIRRNFESMNREMFQILYSTLVRPHLEYAATIWSPYLKSQKDTIDKVQQRATKLIPNLRKKEYKDRLKELNLMSTEVRRKRGDMITTFKILKGKVDLGRSIFQVNTESRTRGHNLKLVINRARTDYRKYFFTNRVCKDWNDLGKEVIESSSVEIFKKAYDHRQDSKRRGGPQSL